MDAFLSYTLPGNVEGDIVYVNFGRLEDYDFLVSNQSVDFSDKICMARYGKGFRGNKITNAAAYGCRGAILYSDPEEVAPLGTDPADVYPNSIFLPGSGIPRGVAKSANGDPETPDWPSIDGVYRVPEEEYLLTMQSTPSQPIGYDDAKRIFDLLEGEEVFDDDWAGLIKDTTYTFGGAFNQATCPGCRAYLDTYNILNATVNKNVLGIIRGEIEPDRYVIMGNHRDAWGFGAGDPSSGTVGLLETARILGQKLGQG